MKNFLRNLMGFNHLQEANNILSNKIADLQRELDGLEESVKDDLLSDLDYELERKVEQQVETEIDDRLDNYDLDDMKDKIEILLQDSSNFDHQISVLIERIDALADKLDTLSILDRLSALEEKLND